MPEPLPIGGVLVANLAPSYRVVDVSDVVERLRTLGLVVADIEIEPRHLGEPLVREGLLRPHHLDCLADLLPG